MAVNWAPVGKQLAGLRTAGQDTYESRLGDLAALDLKLQKAQSRRDLGTQLAGAGYAQPQADLIAALVRGEAGSRIVAAELGMGRQQERGFRDRAVEAYGTGGAEAANQFRAGLGNSVIEATKITNGQAYNPTVAPGSQEIELTAIGDSIVGANNARAGASKKQGDAAMIRANKVGSTRARGGAPGAPKLSEVDKLRIKSALSGIQVEKEAVLERIAQGDEAAKDDLRRIQAEEEAVFARYDGAKLGDAALPDVDTAVADDDLGNEVMQGEDTWYQGPDGVQVKAPRPGARAPAAKRPPVPAAAVEMLWEDPSLRDQFAAKYGPAAADAALAKRPR